MRRSRRIDLTPGSSVKAALVSVCIQHRSAMREDEALPRPVAGDGPVEEHAGVVLGRILHRGGELQHVVPGGRELFGIAARGLDQVGVVIEDRRRERKADAGLLARDLAERQERRRKAELLRLRIGIHERLQVDRDVALFQRALPIEAVERHVRQVVGDHVAQVALQDFLIALLGRAQGHLDLRILRHELAGDVLLQFLEQHRGRILHGDLRVGRLRAQVGRHRQRAASGGRAFQDIAACSNT